MPSLRNRVVARVSGTAHDVPAMDSESESSEHCGQLLASFHEAECEPVLQAMSATCLRVGALQFALMPLVFLLAKAKLGAGAFFLIASTTSMSLAWQLSARASFISWMKGGDWETHLEMVPTRLGLRDSLTLLGSIVEALDPALDAWTAANAEHMMSKEESQKFATAWGRIWLLGPFIAELGLPRLLLLVLVMSTMVQLVAFLWKRRQTLERIQQIDLSGDVELLPHRRWRVWIFLSHMADVGGVILLHDLFMRFVKVEISLSDKVWPVPDRNAAFRTKVLLEALPALWLQISLLGLTMESATPFNIIVTCVSIAFSLFAISKHLHLVFQAVWTGLGFQGANWWSGDARYNCYNLQHAMMFALATSIVSISLARLAGVWLCPEHVLNVTTGCVAL